MALPPTFVGNPGGKGGPLVQPYFGGGGGGAYGGGKGGYQLGGSFPFKKKLQETQSAGQSPPPGGAAYLPRGGGGPGNQYPLYINPYHGIPGFEDYRHDLLRIRGDVVGKPGIQNYPAARGFPDRARVQQISDAMTRLGAMSPPAARTMGTGAIQGDQADAIRRMLKERQYGGGSY